MQSGRAESAIAHTPHANFTRTNSDAMGNDDGDKNEEK